MIVRVKEPFPHKRRDRIIPAGLHDLDDEWAKELIKSGIATVETRFVHEMETRAEMTRAKKRVEDRLEEVEEEEIIVKKSKKDKE